jgi:hypothetical protein
MDGGVSKERRHRLERDCSIKGDVLETDRADRQFGFADSICQSFEGLSEIGNDIGGVFDTTSQPNHVVCDAK